jgi:hypothetical protein
VNTKDCSSGPIRRNKMPKAHKRDFESNAQNSSASEVVCCRQDKSGGGDRIMSAEKAKIFRLAILGIWLPVALGIAIELARDLLKHAIRYFTTSIYFDLQHDIWVELKDSNTWVGLVVAIVLVVVSMWILDNWKWAHPSGGVRIGLLVVSIALTAIVDPFGRTFKKELLEGYKKAYMGEAMADVLKPFQQESPSLVVPDTDQGDQLDCTGNCWLRVSYEVPEMFAERWISLDFDRDLKLIKKSP